jgi:hypothetical protein
LALWPQKLISPGAFQVITCWNLTARFPNLFSGTTFSAPPPLPSFLTPYPMPPAAQSLNVFGVFQYLQKRFFGQEQTKKIFFGFLCSNQRRENRFIFYANIYVEIQRTIYIKMNAA